MNRNFMVVDLKSTCYEKQREPSNILFRIQQRAFPEKFGDLSPIEHRKKVAA